MMGMDMERFVVDSEHENGNGNGSHPGVEGAGDVAAELGRLPGVLESLLFAAGAPVPVARLVEALEGPSRAEVVTALEALAVRYQRDGSGLRLVQVAGGWQNNFIFTAQSGADKVPFSRQQFGGSVGGPISCCRPCAWPRRVWAGPRTTSGTCTGAGRRAWADPRP